jgi:S-adenosylmethionine decarboxylase proenzyme
MSGQSGSTHTNNEGSHHHPALVRVSARFVILTFLSSTLVAFAIGQISCILIEAHFRKELYAIYGDESLASDSVGIPGQGRLPNPILVDGKAGPPQTLYTAKLFDTARSDIHSRWVVTDAGKQECVNSPESAGEDNCLSPDSSPSGASSVEDAEEEEHLPKGQHLLMDIEHVNSDFLNSEERLATAMLELVGECGLTLLSYHCHSLTPNGVSCVGVLLESHVSFHTWPTEGVITLDLFTCGDESLLPVVPVAEGLFGIAKEGSDEKPRAIWAHKLRGFGDEERSGESENSDLFHFPLGQMTDMKQKVHDSHADSIRLADGTYLTFFYCCLDDSFVLCRFCLPKLTSSMWTSMMFFFPRNKVLRATKSH